MIRITQNYPKKHKIIKSKLDYQKIKKTNLVIFNREEFQAILKNVMTIHGLGQ